MIDSTLSDSLVNAMGLIIVVSLALAKALGSTLMYLTEVAKATGKVRDGFGGVVTIAIGMLLGGSLGALTAELADTGTGHGVLIAIGVFAGVIMASSAVEAFKASASVNPHVMVNGQSSDNLEVPAVATSGVDPDGLLVALEEIDADAGNVTKPAEA